MNTTPFELIFGAGPLAQATMRALVKRGKTVKMVNRSGKRPTDIPESVEIIAGDANNTDFTRTITQGASVVYQCAQPEYNHPERFPALQSAILAGASSNGAKLIVGENTYMYGDPNGKPLTEDMPYSAHTRKGKIRAEISSSLLEAHSLGNVRMAIGRGSEFYGPTVLGSALGEYSIIPLLQGKPARVTGALDVLRTYTYVYDMGEALAILGERDEALGQAWHVPNPATLTQRELVTIFFTEAGLPPKFSVMTKSKLRMIGLFIPVVRETVEMIYSFEKPYVVDSSKFVNAFGDISTGHDIAVKVTLKWYRRYLSKD
jgi:nucleoside-diphosphate-sugar epimerase